MQIKFKVIAKSCRLCYYFQSDGCFSLCRMQLQGKGIKDRFMEKGLIQVYSGEGHDKSAMVLGRAIQIASTGRDVVMINFLKRNQNEAFLKRMEPEIKIFRLKKARRNLHNFLKSINRKRSIILKMD